MTLCVPHHILPHREEKGDGTYAAGENASPFQSMMPVISKVTELMMMFCIPKSGLGGVEVRVCVRVAEIYFTSLQSFPRVRR